MAVPFSTQAIGTASTWVMLSVYSLTMNALPFMDELRRLPADKLEETAEFIHKLLEERRLRRAGMIDDTAGSLAGKEG